jgi:hypothetical protein
MANLPIVLGIEQNHDQEMKYCQAFRQHYIYGNPALASLFSVVRCFDSHAVKSSVDSVMSANQFAFITGSGHGYPNQFMGQDGQFIWKTGKLNPPEWNDSIVHLLSCDTGAQLGRDMVRAGAKAFWGYTRPFKFNTSMVPPANLETDTVAEPYFKFDSIIDQGVLQGKNGTSIYKELQDYVRKTYQALVAKANQGLADDLLDNWVNLACPSRNISGASLDWGKVSAKI